MDLYEQIRDTEEFEKYLAIFQRHEITTHDILTRSSKELAQLTCIDSFKAHTNNTELKEVDFDKVKHALREKLDSGIVIRRHSATRGPRCFTTGNRRLDRLLNGGIRTRTITEISGESSTGKSQLLMQLSLFCQLPRSMHGLSSEAGNDCKVAFVSTEAPLPARRLVEMCEANFATMSGGNAPSTDHILTHFISDWDAEAELVMFHKLPKLIKTQNVKVVIIDSISHHLRTALSDNADRTQKSYWKSILDHSLFIDKLLDSLRNMAMEHGVAVIVSNQVTSKPVKTHSWSPDPLNFDYQLGWLSGWDSFVVNYDQMMLKNEQNLTNNGYMTLRPKLGSNELIKSSISHENPKQSLSMLDQQYFRERIIPCMNLNWRQRIPVKLFLSKTSNPVMVNFKRSDINAKSHQHQAVNRIYKKKKLNRCTKPLPMMDPQESAGTKYYVSLTDSLFTSNSSSVECDITSSGYM